MLYIPPITKGEFRQLFHKCTPPTGWPHTLGTYPLNILTNM